MKKFQFKLKALLTYREHIEKMAKEEVARVQLEINHCLKSIGELENRLHSSSLAFEKKIADGISAVEHSSYIGYLKGLKIKISAERELLEKLKNILRAKQIELTKKTVSRKVIENLKEKRKTEYYESLDKQAMADADEMVLVSRSFNEKADKL